MAKWIYSSQIFSSFADELIHLNKVKNFVKKNCFTCKKIKWFFLSILNVLIHPVEKILAKFPNFSQMLYPVWSCPVQHNDIHSFLFMHDNKQHISASEVMFIRRNVQKWLLTIFMLSDNKFTKLKLTQKVD